MMVCSTCRGETRFDWRIHRWTHREDSDHEIFPVVPAAEEVGDFEPEEEIPEPEVRATPKTVEDLPARSGMRQIANLLVKQADWEDPVITYARGPYLSAAGKMLSISDSIVIRSVDKKGRRVIGWWRDSSFDFGYGWVPGGPRVKMTSTELKTFIKEAP